MKIIVKAPNWLGDAVMALPTLASLRLMEPSARITVLTRSSLADLYRGAPSVDEALPYSTWLGGVKAARSAKADVAVILPRSFSSAFMLFTARVPRRIGFRGEGRRPLLTDALERSGDLLALHRSRYFHHLLTRLGQAPEIGPPTIAIPKAERAWASETLGSGTWIGINPGATYGAAKQWFPDRFIEVGRKLKAMGHKLAVFGGPSETELGDRVASETGGISLAGKTGVMQLAAAVSRCRLFLTNDTGPMHVADAVGTRIVAVFGPTDWKTTPPFGKRHEIVRKEIECAPCLKRACPLGHHHCMKWIEVDDVLAACRRALA